MLKSLLRAIDDLKLRAYVNDLKNVPERVRKANERRGGDVKRIVVPPKKTESEKADEWKEEILKNDSKRDHEES